MHTVYPSLPEVKCPVSILAGTDVSATTPTEFIAHYIEDVVKEFPNARFERCVDDSKFEPPKTRTGVLMSCIKCNILVRPWYQM